MVGKNAMHTIEPFYGWRDYYIASEDKKSPFFRQQYSEFEFHHHVYNYYLHPQWDSIGSSTLYCKVLYADYEKGAAIIELIGEWNDTLHNDIMILKEELLDPMLHEGISRFILIGEAIMNFHGSDDEYYEALNENIQEAGGWVLAVNFPEHVVSEMRKYRIHYYFDFNEHIADIAWRKVKPQYLYKAAEEWVSRKLNN